MKRRLTKLVVFLLLGAIVNVAVAWGCAALGRYKLDGYSGMTFSDLELRREWERVIPVPQGVKLYPITYETLGGPHKHTFGLEGILIYGDHLISPGRWAPCGTIALRAGWPRRTLAGERWGTFVPQEYPQIDPLAHFKSNMLVLESSVSRLSPSPNGFRSGTGGLGSPSWYLGREFPLRPIWPGFAINTIFYAAILWLPFAPFQLRRYVRVKRGHCINCGYDLRGDFSAGCSECGWHREGFDECQG